jgi:AAA15 family ATPase/GTPase
MLIEFQVENYRSFRERQVFSMVAGRFPDHRDTNTFDPGLKGFDRILRAAVVYGANAAGKTNLLRAIKFVKDFVVTSASTPVGQYRYTPFKLASKSRKQPSQFQITFAHNGTLYEYGFAMGEARIESEWLTEYAPTSARARGRAMFQRQWDAKNEKYEWQFSSFLKGQRSVWSESTRPDALFLSTAIQLNSVQLRPVFEWFQSRLRAARTGTRALR